MTVAACDPDVHIHEWLRGKAPVGITAPIQLGGVFPVIPPQSVGKEKDRARYFVGQHKLRQLRRAQKRGIALRGIAGSLLVSNVLRAFFKGSSNS